MICTRQVTIEITGISEVAWWTLQTGFPAGATDSVSGTPLASTATSTPPSDGIAVPGVIGNGNQLNDGAGGGAQQTGAGLSYLGNGFSLCFWLNTSLAAGSSGVDSYYLWDSAGGNSFIELFANDTFAQLQINLAGSLQETIVLPAPTGGFDFYCFTYNPDDGKFRASVNNAAYIESVGSYVVPAAPAFASAQLYFAMFLDVFGGTIVFDELALLTPNLSDAQRAFVWNGGAGRTFPL